MVFQNTRGGAKLYRNVDRPEKGRSCPLYLGSIRSGVDPSPELLAKLTEDELHRLEHIRIGLEHRVATDAATAAIAAINAAHAKLADMPACVRAAYAASLRASIERLSA